jgi:hypothetical protein
MGSLSQLHALFLQHCTVSCFLERHCPQLEVSIQRKATTRRDEEIRLARSTHTHLRCIYAQICIRICWCVYTICIRICWCVYTGYTRPVYPGQSPGHVVNLPPGEAVVCVCLLLQDLVQTCSVVVDCQGSGRQHFIVPKGSRSVMERFTLVNDSSQGDVSAPRIACLKRALQTQMGAESMRLNPHCCWSAARCAFAVPTEEVQCTATTARSWSQAAPMKATPRVRRVAWPT